MSETIEIKCGKCGSPMRVHNPEIAMAHDPRMSQFSVIPSWSVDERKCKSCGALNAPMIMNIKVEWIVFEAPQEQKLIQPASMADIPKLHNGLQGLKVMGRG